MSLYDQLSANFYRWEKRGRGVELFPAPVALEPPFLPFPGHRVKFENEERDTGAKPTFLSRLTDKIFRALQPPKPGALEVRAEPMQDEGDAEPMPDWFGEKEPVMEISVRVPGGVAYPAETMAHFLTTLSLVAGIVGLEIIGTADEVTVQLVCQPEEADHVAAQMQAHFPEGKLSWSQENLQSVWSDDEGLSERLVLDFGLYQEFMRPLETGSRIDPFVSLIGGMAHLAEGEAAVYQVLFTPLQAPWAENALAAVTKESGKPFFDDGAELVKQTQAKISRPLYGVVLRLAAKAPAESGLQRTWAIVRGMAPALRLYSRQGGQSLMPLPNTDYDNREHCDDLLWRRSRRCGMILNLDELVALAHWPSPAVKCEKLRRVPEREPRQAPDVPEEALQPGALILGDSPDPEGGEPDAIILNGELRLRHMHVIGGSGTGKSTLLLSLLEQDIEYGRGFALLDPHGDLADAVLARIPEERLDDVVILDPSDEQHIVPLNVISAHTDYERTLLASDLVSVFRRLSTSWGDRMNVIFQNLILAFLDHREGGTLADMRRFLVDEKWRASFLAGVDDPDVQFYWQATFPKLDGQKSIGPILTRLETLLTPKPIRLMVSQRQNRIDFNEVMDEGRILIVRLPMGQIGKENAWMVGSLVMVKLQQAAMARARKSASERRPFYCYVDEAQHFVTPSMAEILAGARKYGLGLVLAHQDLHQLSQNADVAAAVLTNAATRIVFRTSEADARALKGDFAHYEAKEFTSLGRGEAICRIERSDQDFDLRVYRPEDVDADEAEERRNAAINASRERYTIPREQVEAELRESAAKYAVRSAPPKAGAGETKRTERTTRAPQEDVESVSAEPVGTTNGEVDKKLETSQVLDSAGEQEKASVPATSSPRPPKDEAMPPKPAGLGRGGNDHQIIVGRIATEGASRGYKAAKEASVPGGRVDVTLESRQRRIAIEVAVNSNTAHEIGNLTKCLEAGFDWVVSVAPLVNVRLNIEKAAAKTFTPDQLQKLKFFSSDALIEWLDDLAYDDGDAPPPPEEVKIIGGRKVKIKTREISPEERRRTEAEQIEAIADIVNRNRGGDSS